MKCLKNSLDPRTIASKIRRGLRWDQVSATSRSLPMVLVSYCLMFPNLASSPLVTGRHSPFECQGAIALSILPVKQWLLCCGCMHCKFAQGGVPCKTPNRCKGNIQRPMVMLLKDCLLPDGPKFGSNHGTGSQSPMTCGQMRLLMIFFLARCCLGQVPGGAPFSQRSEQATACTNRMQIRN